MRINHDSKINTQRMRPREFNQEIVATKETEVSTTLDLDSNWASNEKEFLHRKIWDGNGLILKRNLNKLL